jgi:hypothetical protein
MNVLEYISVDVTFAGVLLERYMVVSITYQKNK